MASQAILYKAGLNSQDYVPTVKKTAGEVVLLPDGRAGVVATDLAIGDAGTVYDKGIYDVLKTASIVLLEGQKVYWDRPANTASYTGEFVIGVAMADAAAADATVRVGLNVAQNPLISLHKSPWEKEAVLGQGVDEVLRNTPRIAFDAVAEIAQAALISQDSVPIADGPIFEAWINVENGGDHAALDINFGLAAGSHATNFDLVSDYVVFHMDGASLNLMSQSDDTVTPVAAQDTTFDVVAGTWFFVQIDVRDKAAVRIFVNGIEKNAGTLHLAVSVAALKAIMHIEKISNDTLAKVESKEMIVRTTKET